MFERDRVTAFHCPRWSELPSVPLYMDQVILVVSEALRMFARSEEPIVTPTMVNNYVKLKLVPPPEKKRYSKPQVSRLIVFSLLKRVFSMQETAALIDIMVDAYGSQEAYDLFCAELERMLCTAFAGEDTPLASPTTLDSAQQLLQAALTTLLSKEMVLQNIAARTKQI